MKIFIATLIATLILFTFTTCKKELFTIDSTEFTLEVERNIFEDSIYIISDFSLTSTNDSILNFAKLKLIDDSTKTVIWDDLWTKFRKTEFALDKRKSYRLNFILYRTLNGKEKIEYSDYKIINNKKVPLKIQLLSATVDPLIIGSEDYYGSDVTIGNAYSTNVNVSLSIDDYDYQFDKTGEISYNYLHKFYAPKKLAFTFNNVFFDVKKVQDNKQKWMHYELIIGYPVVYVSDGSSIGELREISFFIDPYKSFHNNEVNNNQIYAINNDPDWTSAGKDYSGTIKIKWIYEN